MTQRYTFKSGYSIDTKSDYNRRFFHLAVEEWHDTNPTPEPPITIRQVQVKGGFKDIEEKNWSAPSFLQSHDAWVAAKDKMVADLLLNLAVDRLSIDYTILDAARAWGAENNFPMPEDDLRCYLQVISDDSDEIRSFFGFLNDLQGISGALVDVFLKTFRGQGEVQGGNGVGVGRSDNGQDAGVGMGSASTINSGQGG